MVLLLLWLSAFGLTTHAAQQLYSKRPPPSGCQLLNPIPTNYVCEQRGDINITNPYEDDPDPAVLSNIQECLDLCARRQTCQTFGFNPKTKLCSLIYNSAKDINFVQNSHSFTTYSEYSCYDCPPVDCPQDSSMNLVDNGGFEYSSNASSVGPWYRYGYGPGREGEIVHPGSNGSKNAWRCTWKNNVVELCELYQDFKMCQPGTYALTFDYKALPSRPKNVYNDEHDVDVFVGDAIIQKQYSPKGSKTWKTETGYFNCDDRISRCDGTVNFWTFNHVMLDNIQVYPVPNLKYAPGASNLIVNGNFESGSIQPWSATPNTSVSIVSPGYESNFQLQWKSSGFESTLNLQQNIPTTPGKSYLLTFDFYTEREEGLDISIGSGDRYYEFSTQSEYSYQIPYLADARTVVVNFLFYGGSGPGKATLDNVDMREVE